MDFAQNVFRDEVHEPGQASMGAHLRQLARSRGEDPELHRVDPQEDCPEGFEFLWSVFVELNNSRASGFGPGPISFTEIRSWEELKGIKLAPWEVAVIKRVDTVFLEEAHARSSSTKPRRPKHPSQRGNEAAR